jgi:hypothetical protein
MWRFIHPGLRTRTYERTEGMCAEEYAAVITRRLYRMRFVAEHKRKHIPFAQTRMDIPGVLLRPFWRTGTIPGYDHYRFHVKQWRPIPRGPRL